MSAAPLNSQLLKLAQNLMSSTIALISQGQTESIAKPHDIRKADASMKRAKEPQLYRYAKGSRATGDIYKMLHHS